ncbi:triacylglycerol lipase [Accumulibacter sp.]|nr:alpha/beta fold hydrolase [Accumulibacter sp.]MCM8596356.1 GPI inositol-deacylase [Accumulibacter sp.]MDS4050505.1 hypothetical protein [Accumulibacter sp.]
MHQTIATGSFSVLRRLPLLGGPARLVQIVHDGIVGGVYQAIHLTSGVLLDAAAVIEERRLRQAPAQEPGRLATRAHSALNGVFGDHLAATDNRLAIAMTLRHQGTALPLDGGSLRAALPDTGRRLCLFIHGLACDESSWRPRSTAAGAAEVDFARQLQADLGYTPLHLRYNSGLPIDRNARELAVLLERLIAAWPQPDSEMIIVGHSMGGLVAIAACGHAAATGMNWPQATRMLIGLGAPQLGSPLERFGHLVTSALQASKVTLPLARIAAARSQGIRDLRQGPGAAQAHPTARHIAYRFLGGSLAEDVEHRFGRLFGDGLVTLGSATAQAIADDVQTAALGRLGHMALLTDARVYRQISRWVAALDDPPAAAADDRVLAPACAATRPVGRDCVPGASSSASDP